MNRFRAMSRMMLVCDLRDAPTLIFTFLVPVALLIALVLSFGDMPSASGGDSVNEVSSNVVAFGTAFVGIFAGASHLALWRENGMLRLLRAFPISTGTILLAQGIVGVMFAVAQALLLIVIGSTPWLGMTPLATAPAALVPIVLGYLMFFFLGVLIGILVPSMAGVSMLAVLLVIPLGFAGGAMMPMEGLPDWLQTLAPFTPIYHLREAVTMPLVDVGAWSDVGLGCLYLIGVSAVLFVLVRALMRWR
ncbi:ABC transporter permease [Brevibacterium sp. FAM 24630]|uniref:ABC transporter permease n=1 Tax=unclassified Brevibacterium TaxID=2614124 RepID=UPI003C7E5809